MATDLVTTAADLFAVYGLIVLFVLLVLDNAGIPFPTELVLIMAVGLYVTDFLSLVYLIAVATGAALVGSLILYGICYKGGRPLVEKHPKLFMMNPRRLARLERVFGHPVGKSLVFFLRLFPLTRVLVSIPAGIARMRAGTFMLLTFVGMLIYHVVLVMLASRFGAEGGGTDLQAAIGSPAWQFVQANQVVTGLAILALGLLYSLYASRGAIKDPEWASPSKIGWVAERIAVWGGLALLVVTLVDVTLVYRALAYTGMDLPLLMEQINWDAESFLTGVAILSIIIGFPILLYGRRARRRKWEAYQIEYGIRGTAEVLMKTPESAVVSWEQASAQNPHSHTETLRSAPKKPSERWDPGSQEGGKGPGNDSGKDR